MMGNTCGAIAGGEPQGGMGPQLRQFLSHSTKGQKEGSVGVGSRRKAGSCECGGCSVVGEVIRWGGISMGASFGVMEENAAFLLMRKEASNGYGGGASMDRCVRRGCGGTGGWL